MMDLLFKAFADQTRLRILNLLSMNSLCVNDIVKILNIHQPKISRHLTYLKYAGLVKSRRAGVRMYYELDKPKSGMKKTLLDHFNKGIFQEVGLMQNDLRRLKERRN